MATSTSPPVIEVANQESQRRIILGSPGFQCVRSVGCSMPSGGEVPRPGATESSVFTAPGIFTFTLLPQCLPDLTCGLWGRCQWKGSWCIYLVYNTYRSPETFTRTFGKVVECPQSMSLCQGLPGALETRVTFSEDMHSLSALIAMSASGVAPCDEVGC